MPSQSRAGGKKFNQTKGLGPRRRANPAKNGPGSFFLLGFSCADKPLKNQRYFRELFGPEKTILRAIRGDFLATWRLYSPFGRIRRIGGRVTLESTMPRRARADIETPPVRLVAPVITAELPLPPDHLSPAMQQWWRQVMADYELEPHHLHVLEAACDAWDRMVQARTVLAREGLTVTTKSGVKQHPAINVERDSRLGFARLLRELDLDCPTPRPEPQGGWRPPAIRSNRRR
jgi:P27 family predicted phage terminase small subunit